MAELQTHLRQIVEYIHRGRLVPFLGAGANQCERPDNFRWRQADGQYLPTGKELALELSHRFNYPSPPACPNENCPCTPELDLARAAQYGDTMGGRGELYDELRTIFEGDYRPTPIHTLLASLPETETGPSRPENRHILVVTTNYDDLMERAFEHASKQFDVVYYDPDHERWKGFWQKMPNKNPEPIKDPNATGYIFCERRPLVLKIHGTIDRTERHDREAFVITEDDYIEYLAEEPLDSMLPKSIMNKLIENHLLFLGYSLRDWNLRVFFRRLKANRRREYKSWAVFPAPLDPVEQRVWAANKVETIISHLKDVTQALRDAVPSGMGTGAD